jgi:hypothetical protein
MIQGLSAAMNPFQAGVLAVRNESLLPQGKVAVPVRPLLALNMMFKHVVGVPVSPPAESMPAEKLQLLDRLIDWLTNSGGDTGGAWNTEPIEARLATVGAALRRLAAERGPYASGLMPEPGLLVNRLA